MKPKSRDHVDEAGFPGIKPHHGHYRFLFVIVVIWVIALLPKEGLFASDFGPLRDGEMITHSRLIVEIDLSGPHDKPNVQITEVLEGKAPDGFTVPVSTHTYHNQIQERHRATLGNSAVLELDDLPESSRWILFFRPNHKGNLDTFHPACVQPASRKERILEILAMSDNPAPFVSSQRFAGDLDLIHILGVRFNVFNASAPAFPELDKALQNTISHIPAEIPWQRARFTLRFSFQPARKPMLQMSPCDAQGILPDFVRKMARFEVFDRWAKEGKTKIPSEFEIQVDTTGPEKIGELEFPAATAFLREQLRSDNVEVVKAAYEALVKLMDSESVPIAVEMLKHLDLKFQNQAVVFLSYAKDSRSIEALCAKLDELQPRMHRDNRAFSDQRVIEVSLEEAFLYLNDVQCVPALKRAVVKGYTGGRVASALSRLGDESAFEALISHLRNPEMGHFPGDLEKLVERSNMPVEPWMIESRDTWSSDHEKQNLMNKHWLEWWDAHKTEFKIVRTWEEACLRMRSK